LLVLYTISGIRINNGHSVFSPVAWFMMFYVITFLAPQLMIPLNDFTLLIPGNIESPHEIARVVVGQKVVSLFLAGFILGFALLRQRPHRKNKIESFTSLELLFVTLAGFLGLAAVGLLIIKFDPSMPRSSIVQSTSGKLLYAMSFWLTLAMIVWSANFFKWKRWLLMLAVFSLFGFSLFLLGGRGRVVWPIASTFAWACICGKTHFQPRRLSLFITCFFLFLQAMDPVLMVIRGEPTNVAMDKLKEEMSFKALFLDRNFETFQIVAVIASYDEIQPETIYLVKGSQAAFMGTYFPDVAARGIGFPASLPGGLWIAGKYTMVGLGSIAFGLFFGLLTLIYSNLRSEFEVAVYCVAMPWLALISGAYLVMYIKVGAAILPGLIFALVLRFGFGSQRIQLKLPLTIRLPRIHFGNSSR
ncbi:MAG: hypothetical protein AAGA30_04210, partial [Planctomycetota bacterium]